MAKLYKFLLLFLVLAFGIKPTNAQELSTQGKVFWMTFMESIGTPDNTPELKIVISSNKAVTGTVKNLQKNLSQPFSIGVGGGVDTVLIKTFMGYCTGSEATSTRNVGLLIQASDTVAVAAQNTKQFSCDAALIYPVEALGVDYRVFSHMGDQTGGTSTYRSTFAIVATEDNTTIDITPSVATSGGNAQNTKYTIVLMKGESYQVKSSSNKNDLTGTLIQAQNCKKIAVFGGATRASVIYGACAASYDHLYEQLMPINLWGKKFVCIPSIYAKGKQRKAELVKVVSNTNSTFVRCNGRGKLLSVAGQWDTFFITGNSVITANKPVGVCQYALTEACDGVGGAGSDTDPYQMWVPPIEQSLKSLGFVCENALTINKFFLNVIVKTSYTSTFKIDGAAPSVSWKTVSQDTSYSFIQQDGLTLGKHNMTCPFGFSANLYAYGDHGSYGYNAGSAIKPLSFYTLANGKSSADFELDSAYFSICQGTTVPFDGGSSSPPNSWKWVFSDGVVKTSKSFSRIFVDTGIFKVKMIAVRTTNGTCNGSNTIEDTTISVVKVYGKPTIKLLNDTTICRGNSFYLTSVTKGDTNYTFTPNTWLSCSKCFKPKASPIMDTSYAVVATTKGCLPSRDTFKVKVRDSLHLYHGNDTIICRGTSTTLKAWATGGLVASQTLTWDHGLGTGSNKVVSPKVTSTYRVILNDGCTKDGSGGYYADTAFIKVTVYDSLKLTMPRDTVLCEGNSVTFTPKIVGGRTGTTLLTWDNGLGTGFSKNITIGSVNTTYKAVLSDGCTNPKDSGYVKITVRPGLRVDTILYQTPVCRNTLFKVSVKLSGGDSTGYRVKLLNTTLAGPPVIIDSFKNTAYPYFNIKIPDDSKFKISFTQTCNANNAPLKAFSVNIKNSLNIVSTVLVDTVCTGESYDIKVTGSNSDNIPIKFILKKKTGSNAYTPLDSMTDLANASFKVTPTVTQTDYIIIGTDKCNRDDTSKFKLMMRAPLAFINKLVDVELCRKENTTFTSAVKDGKLQSWTYNWTDASNGALLGNNASVLVAPTASMDVALKVDDGCSAPIYDTTRIWLAPIVTDSTLATNLAGCEPYSTAFKFPLTQAQTINTKFDWIWYFDNNTPFSNTASSGGQTHPDINKNYASAGIYYGRVEMVLSGGKKCYDFKQDINVYKQATAAFSYAPTTIDIIEPLVTFYNASTGATNYTWNFGDKTPLDYSDNPTHSYSDTGSFTVYLIATNANNCNDTIPHTLTVLDIFRIWIPNAFSPNLDEFNTNWAPNVTSMEKMEFQIFNRWGEEVFKSDGSVKWSGQYANQPDTQCPEGIYYYHIKVRDNRKHWHYYNGTITLLR